MEQLGTADGGGKKWWSLTDSQRRYHVTPRGPYNTQENRDSDLHACLQRGAVHKPQKVKAREHLPVIVTASSRLITMSVLVLLTWETGQVLFLRPHEERRPQGRTRFLKCPLDQFSLCSCRQVAADRGKGTVAATNAYSLGAHWTPRLPPGCPCHACPMGRCHH